MKRRVKVISLVLVLTTAALGLFYYIYRAQELTINGKTAYFDRLNWGSVSSRKNMDFREDLAGVMPIVEYVIELKSTHGFKASLYLINNIPSPSNAYTPYRLSQEVIARLPVFGNIIVYCDAGLCRLFDKLSLQDGFYYEAKFPMLGYRYSSVDISINGDILDEKSWQILRDLNAYLGEMNQ